MTAGASQRHRAPSLLVFTSTRADFGIIQPLLIELAERTADFGLFVTGTHLSDPHGRTREEIDNAGWPIASEIELFDNDACDAAAGIATGIHRFSSELRRIRPEHAVVLGDRFEAFAFAVACHTERVPLAHLHGGEVTVGALDDAFRHSITKFADLHLVASDEFGRRVVQLGESPASVHTVGALGLDAIRRRVADLPKIPRGQQILLAYHPETMSSHDPATSVKAILDAAILTGRPILATGPNADPGGDSIREVLLEYSALRQITFVESLGSDRFIEELSNSAVMVGNSSAAIIEAPYLGTPTVDIGMRQRGRPAAATVIRADEGAHDLTDIIEHAVTLARTGPCATPYGDGRAAAAAAEALLDAASWASTPKQFFDLELEVASPSPKGLR